MYITVNDADTYFDSRLDSTVWYDTSDTDKTKAIVTAGKLIDRLNFAGDKAESDQEHQFPRGDDTEIPADIQEACCELAYALLDGVDPEIEYDNQSMTSQAFGNVRSTYDRNTRSVNVLAGIVSIRAWRLLLPYLRDFYTVELTRVD